MMKFVPLWPIFCIFNDPKDFKVSLIHLKIFLWELKSYMRQNDQLKYVSTKLKYYDEENAV